VIDDSISSRSDIDTLESKNQGKTDRPQIKDATMFDPGVESKEEDVGMIKPEELAPEESVSKEDTPTQSQGAAPAGHAYKNKVTQFSLMVYLVLNDNPS
jgi:hypothetical protein